MAKTGDIPLQSDDSKALYQQSCSQIDNQMLPSKISYFFKMAKFAYTEYTILFYVSIGLSPVEAGKYIF